MKYAGSCAGLVLLVAQCSFGTVFPTSSVIQLHATADAGLGPVYDDHSVGQTTTLNALSTSVFAQAFNGTSQDSAQSSALASWTSAGQGHYSVDTKFTSDYLPYQSAAVGTGGDGFIYSFVSDVPATLKVDFGITYAGSYTYAMRLYLLRTSDGVRLADFDFSGLTSGTLDYPVAANENYSIQFYDGSNLNSYLPALTSEVVGTFDYQIVAVPEPASATLLALGGLALPRRRRQ